MADKVGVIGLGSMGLGVARTLVAKGFAVHARDVRPEVVASFASEVWHHGRPTGWRNG